MEYGFLRSKLGRDKNWHPHLHCALDAEYVSRKKISHAWEKITTDSPVIDIRLIRDIEVAANYVSKYAVKPCRLKDFTLEERKSLLSALFRRRLCGTWGTAKKMRLTAKPVFDCSNWENIGNWRTVIELIDQDEVAKRIWKAWQLNQPLEEGVSLKMIDDFIADKPPPELKMINKFIEDQLSFF